MFKMDFLFLIHHELTRLHTLTLTHTHTHSLTHTLTHSLTHSLTRTHTPLPYLPLSTSAYISSLIHFHTVLIHKCFHRYVVRAKRGTAQSTRDSKGGHIKSAGATMRRYNEVCFDQVPKEVGEVEKIREMLRANQIFFIFIYLSIYYFFAPIRKCCNKTSSRS